MVSGGPNRGQGRKSTLSKVDNSTTPAIQTYFKPKTPLRHDLSPSSSSSEGSNNTPDTSSPSELNTEEEEEEEIEEEELENLDEFSAFNGSLKGFLAAEDDILFTLESICIF